MRKKLYLVIIFLIAVFAYTKNTFAESECVNPNGYRSARIHLMYGDVELTTDSEYPGGFYSRYESENNVMPYLGANSAYYCKTVNLPGNMFVNDEVGILDWYDNPEFTGKPVYSIYINSDDIYLYAKTAPAISLNVSGRKKRMLIGKKYDTTYVDSTDYNVDYKTEIIDEYDENNNVIGKAHVRAYYRTLIPSDRTVTVDNIHTASYFNKIYYYPRGVDNNTWSSRTRSYTFTYVFGTNKTTYPFYMDSKLSDTDWELSQINKLYYITPIPKYYKYISYIDENGNEYDPYNFIPTAEYAGLNLTPVFDTKDTCGRYTVESYLGGNGQAYPEHVFKQYEVLDDDLDGKYVYKNNKQRVDVNTCIDHGLTIKTIYSNVPAEDQTTYKVIYPEGNDIVEAGSLYTLPQTTKDISIRHIIYLKYQDGVTEDSNVIFHVVREYDYWTVDGVRYEPGDQIVINKDTLLIPKYKIKSIGNHDLPEPVRSNYRFVGWFDAPAGGNLIDYFDEGFPERYILYAHWVPSDKVFVVRPDNIVVYLERGSKYKLPGIPSKEPVTVANVALDYNDGSGMVKQSRVMKYYDEDGYTLDGQKYYPDQNYVVNHDTWLIPEYKERIEAVTFNSAEKEGASFLGWYDDPVAGNKYTSYSGTQDLTLYAHWGDAEEYVTITTPDQSYEVLKGSSFIMPTPSGKTGESFPVTFNFNYSGAPSPVVKEVKSEYVPNGWFYEDQHFDVGEVIIAENDMTLTPDYVQNVISPEFPSTPERFGYKFNSWRNSTASSGYKTYDGFYGELASITLYAIWNTENYYTFPALPVKDDEVVAHLTLKYQDGVSNDKVIPIYKKYTPDCWTISSSSSAYCFKPGERMYVPGKYIEGKFPRYTESYTSVELYNETREGYYFLGWYDSPNGGTKYTSYGETEDLTLYARWSTTPPDDVLCQRATTLHTSNGKTYGQIGTPGTLVPGDAFDCDVNGDGVYDADTERFYYINDHYNSNTGTYDNDYASFIYYTDYINQAITNVSDTSTFSKWSGKDYYGPDVAIAALPTYSDWPNVNVYEHVKHANTPLGYTYNQIFNNLNIHYSLYADYDYSSARLLNAKELMDSGCIYEYNLGDGTYYNINSTCNFLVENVRTNINDPLREAGYWTESFGDLCIEDSCAEKKLNAWELILDNGQTSWSGAHIQERGAYYDRGVRPVIDVAKTKLGEDIQPTIVHTITFPEGKVLNALHNSKFEFGRFNGTINTEYNVTFNYNDGVTENYETKVTYSSTPTKWKIGETTYNTGDLLTVTKDALLEYESTDVISSAVFPENPTREGYTFVGWYDTSASAGGNKYTSYDEKADTTLYARWKSDTPNPNTHTIYYPDGSTEVVEHGSTFAFPINKSKKTADTLGTVTFKFNNGIADSYSSVKKEYLANGWKISTDHYNDGDVITVNSDLTLSYDYIDYVVGAQFPKNPTKNGYTFSGWYDQVEDGVEYTEYNGEEDITLYAQYINSTPTPGKKYTLPKNREPKADDVYNVTFNKFNGEPSYVAPVTAQYTPSGWLVNDVPYNDGDEILYEEGMEIVPNYVKTVIPVVFPEDPTNEDYKFLGWYDTLSNGTKYTSYSEEAEFTLYAYWSSLTPTPGKLYNLGVNDIPKDPETFTVYFKKTRTGNVYASSEVHATYTPNGWLVNGQHYNDNEVILIDANTHILPDYTPHGTEATFPEDPTLDDYIFVGWYDSVAGGNKFTSYNEARNITLYAHWKSDIPDNNDILCRRATQLHRLLCEADGLMCAHPYLGTGHYDYKEVWHTTLSGSYGTPGELHDGDAFDCDVNGDGVFDEETERFYYISDWYDTDWSVRTYDTSYATLIYYSNVTNGQPSVGDTYAYADADSYDLNFRELQPVTPDIAMTHLPTTEQWPNVSLKSNVRTMQDLNGSPFTYTTYDAYGHGMTTEIPVDYTGYAARLLTTKELYVKNTEIPQTVLNGLGNGPGETAALNPYRRHIFENTEFYKFGSIDTDIYTESIEAGRYNLEEENPPFYGAVVMYGSVPNENGERTFGAGITWYPFRNETASVRPVIDVPKTRIESAICSGDEHTVRYEDGTIETVADGTVITFGTNNLEKPDEVAATITFNTHDYKNTVVRNNVMRTFTPNGWRINDNHFDDGDTYEVHCDIYITRDYIETIIPAEYPDKPFNPGYNFSSWYGPAYDGNPEHYSLFIEDRDVLDFEMNITLDAQMHSGHSCFYAGTNKESKDDSTINMTFDYQDGVTDNNVITFTKQYTPNGWLIGGKHYDDGAYVCPGYNTYPTVEPDFVEVSIGNYFPEDPTRNDGFVFTGWFDQVHSGTQYTSYFGDDDITFYAHWYNPDDPENYYTVTYGDGNKESVPAGTTIIIPANNSTKPNENYEVLYKPENGEEDFTEIVTKKYTANGYLIDNVYYAPGQLYVVNSDTTLVYNYDISYENAYFPNGVARDGYSLLGWFKEKSGGTRVTTLDGLEENITLYAHWFKQTDNLCRRAKVLHTAPCSQGTYYNASNYSMLMKYQTRCTYAGWDATHKGTTIKYGNLGTAGILNLDDAFTCDVNGDGIYDEETERFYYVGDFFDTTTMTSNADVAVMVYYSNVIDGQNDNVTKVAYNQTGNGYDGPDMNLISNLPTAEQWSNTTLYHTQRDLIGASFVSYSGFRKGKTRNDNKETLNVKLDYTGYAARLLNSADFMIRPAHITKGAACFDASQAATNSTPTSSDYYRWSKFFCFGLLENTTFNDGFDDEQNRYYVENVSANGNNYAAGYVQTVGYYNQLPSSADLTVASYSVRPVIDVPKTRINLDLPDGNDIYIDDVKQTRIYTNESYTVPEGTDKASEDIATVTFNYNDGETESTTSKVTKSFEFNNFKLDNSYFEPNDVLVPSLYVDTNEDVRLVSNYIEKVSSAVFPENPTREGFTFKGWIDESVYDSSKNQKLYTKYTGDEDLTLYAAWELEQGYYIVTYLDNGEIELYAAGDIITVPDKLVDSNTTVTFTYTDQSTSSSVTTTKDYSTYRVVDKYAIGATEYSVGDEITVNDNLLINRTYTSLEYDEEPFDPAPEFTGYRFAGWFTSSNGGGKLVNNFKEFKQTNPSKYTVYGHYIADNKYMVFIDNVLKTTVTAGSNYQLPAGSQFNKDVATVKFINGSETTTKYVRVTKSFVKYRVVHNTDPETVQELASGKSITVNSDVYITSLYNTPTIRPVTITDLENTDYQTFKGWYTGENGTGVRMTGDYSESININLYAHFVGKDASYTFKDNDKSTILGYKNSKYNDLVDTSSIISLNEMDSDYFINYVMNNGTTNNDVTHNLRVTRKIDHWVDDTNKIYSIIHTTDFAGEKTLYAVYGASYKPSVTLITPDDDIYPGYDFEGWYTLPLGGKLVDESYIDEAKNYTLYAHWTRNNQNICSYSTGVTEECTLGDEITVPNIVTSNVARVNEIANGLGEYKNYIYGTKVITKKSYVSYYEVDGNKYYPGDVYTVGENPVIKVKYSDEYIDTVTLDSDMSLNVANGFFNDGLNHEFIGWYTDRNNGDIVLSYNKAEDINVYAHYKDEDDDTVNVRFNRLDGTVQEFTAKKKDKIVLTDSNIFSTTFKVDPDNGDAVKDEYIIKTDIANRFNVNGKIYHSNDEITLDTDMVIYSIKTDTSYRISPIINTPVKDGYVFTGWFYNNQKVDLTKVTDELYDFITNKTLVAHYLEYNPNEEVIVDFDGDIRVVPIGTTETLPSFSNKASDTFKISFDDLYGTITDVVVKRAYSLKNYTVNNFDTPKGATLTYNENTTIRSVYDYILDYEDTTLTYPEFPEFNLDNFVGWRLNVDTYNTVQNVSQFIEDTTLYALYQDVYKFDVDGDVSYVPAGYTYIVPNKAATSTDSINIKLNYNYEDHNDLINTKVYWGGVVGYQLINDVRYNPDSIYVVTADTVIRTKIEGDKISVFNPEVTIPTRDGYNFNGWYSDDINDYVDLDSINPDTKEFNNKVIYAVWSKYNPNTQTLVHYKDEYKNIIKTDVVNIGDTINLSAEDASDSISFVLANNVDNDTYNMSVTTNASFDYFKVNDRRYNASTYQVNEETYVEVVRNITTTKSCGADECPEVIDLEPNTYYGEYRYDGVYTSLGDDKVQVDIKNITGTDSKYDNETLYIIFGNISDTIVLTVDDEVFIIPKGLGKAPDAKTKDSDRYQVVFDYNDSTGKKVSKDIIVNYTFNQYKTFSEDYDGFSMVTAGSSYYFNANTTMYSTFNKSYEYPELINIPTSHFIGWYTSPTGGEHITSLEGVEQDIILYARYDNDTLGVYIDNVKNDVLYGNTFTLPSGQAKSSESITVTLDYAHDNLTEEKTITTNYTFDHYLMDDNSYNAGYSFKVYEDKYVTSVYSESAVISPNYVDPTRDGYIFVKFIDENGNTVKVNELTAANKEYDGKTLTAVWQEYNPDSQVIVIYDGENKVVNYGTKLSELGDSPIKPDPEVITIYIDYNDGTGTIETKQVAKNYVLNTYIIDGTTYPAAYDMKFTKDTTIVNTTYKYGSIDPDLINNLPQGVVGIYTTPTGGNALKSFENVNDQDTLYYRWGTKYNVYLDDVLVDQLQSGERFIFPINNKYKEPTTVAHATFKLLNGEEDIVKDIQRSYAPNGWRNEHSSSILYPNGSSYKMGSGDFRALSYFVDGDVIALTFPEDPKREGYRFDGWYTDEEYTSPITSYAEAQDITIYAKWVKQLTVLEPDNTVSIVDYGSKRILGSWNDRDLTYFNITFKYNYENAPSDKVVRVAKQDIFTNWQVNAETYEVGDEITFVTDTVISPNYETVVSNNNLPNDPTRTGYTFKGWYDSYFEAFANKVDVTKVTDTTTVYALWEEFDPTTQVKLTVDGNPTIHNKGEVIELSEYLPEPSYYENIATVTFDMIKSNIPNKYVYIKKHFFIDHILINGNNHEASGSYTLNEDTVINTVWNNEMVIPTIPKVNEPGFLGFYTSTEYDTKVTSLDNITRDITYYAKWDTEYVTVLFDGEEIQVTRGIHTLPSQADKENRITIYLHLLRDFDHSYTGDDYPPYSELDVVSGDIITTSHLDYYEVNGIKVSVNTDYDFEDYTVINSVYTETNTDTFDHQNDLHSTEKFGYGASDPYDSDYKLLYWLDDLDTADYDEDGIIDDWWPSGHDINLYKLTGNDSKYNNKHFYAYYDSYYDDYWYYFDDQYDEDDISYDIKRGQSITLDPDQYNIPTTKNPRTFDITFDYNDGTNRTYIYHANEVSTLDYFTANGKGKYLPYSDYEFYLEYIEDYSVHFVSHYKPVRTSSDSIPQLDNLEGWYTSDGIKITEDNINSIPDAMTLYARYDYSTKHLTFDGQDYPVLPNTTEINPLSEGYASEQIGNKFKLTLVYDEETVEHEFSVAGLHNGWTDENGTNYGEVINVNAPGLGTNFTSIYEYKDFNPIDLSIYDNGNPKFIGWFTSDIGGEQVYEIDNPVDTTLYAHYAGQTEAIVTIDGELYVYTIGETFTLPNGTSKPGSVINVTFDHNNGTNETTVKPITYTYEFKDYLLEEDETSHNAGEEITVTGNMTFTSTYTDTTTYPEWPDDPTYEGHIFLSWYTARNGGVEVFNYSDITKDKTLYAHYMEDPNTYVILTNTLTGEQERLHKTDKYVFTNSKFNEDIDEKLGTITFKFNAPGYPDEEKEMIKHNYPSGFYVNNDTNALYDVNTEYEFTEDTNITPIYDDATAIVDSHIGLDIFDYSIDKLGYRSKCFSKVNDVDNYTCYNEYDEADGDITLYLIWLKDVKITTPTGEYYQPALEPFEVGTNSIYKMPQTIATVTFKYNDDVTPDNVQTINRGYETNGWLANGEHVDDNQTIYPEVDTIIEPDYIYTTTSVVMPSSPSRDGFTFAGWNSLADGTGTSYTSANSIANEFTNDYKDIYINAVWVGTNVTITFDSQEGPSVSPETIDYGTTLSTLPSISRDGYRFDGWYTDLTYTTKVTTSTVFKVNTTLYARWIKTNTYFEEEGPYVFDGTNYIDTEIPLYNNDNWRLDYEIGFRIDAYNPSGISKQAVFVNNKLEDSSKNYPGIVFRRKDQTNDQVQLTQTISGTKVAKDFTYTLPLEVKIYRKDKTIYYKVGDSEILELQDMSDFNQQFEQNVWFGAAPDANGNPFRYIKATLSNMYVKLGEAKLDDEVTIYYPDGSTEIVKKGTSHTLTVNDMNKPDQIISKVTFKYDDGVTDDVIGYVKNTYTPNGFILNGVHYNDESTFVANEDIYITRDYVETRSGVSFPEDPTREGFTFEGWFDGETEYTSYSGDNDITLTANWDSLTVTVTYPDGTTEVHDKGDLITLGENDVAGSSTLFTVTYVANNGTPDYVSTLEKGLTPNGWLANDVHYDDNASFNVYVDTIISRNYTETLISSITKPSTNPVKEGKVFVEWNTEEDGTGLSPTLSELNSHVGSGTLTLYAVYEDSDITITFNSKGGSSIDPITGAPGLVINELPVPTKDGYEFDGWYTDESYTTKVEDGVTFRYSQTLYARWIDNKFPKVFDIPYECVFNGKDNNITGLECQDYWDKKYIDTGIALYSSENKPKDYEVSFKIVHYDPNEQLENQATLFNTKREASGYPGLVFRNGDKNKSTFEFASRKTSSQNASYSPNIAGINQVKIYRITNKNTNVQEIFYSINGAAKTKLNDLSSYNPEFNLTAWFGAAPKNADGTQAQRYIVGTLSDMYIKLGEYPGKEYTVEYPDGTIEYHDAGDVIELGDNEFNKPDVRVANVTFKYQDDVTPDTLAHVTKTYTPNGWLVNDVAYADSTSFTVEEDTVIKYSFVETTVGPTFETPTWENHSFAGWFDSSEGGTQYESYTGDEDITLYAQWTEMVIIDPPGTDPIVVPKGSDVTLPNNGIAKASENLSEVTFEPENGDEPIVRYVQKVYTPNGWLINGVHYDDGATYTANESVTPVADYTYIIVPISFPDDPTFTGKDFTGWYTDRTGGDKVTSYSDEENDLTLYAQYVDHIPNIITPGGVEHPDDDGNYTFKENTYNKDEELLATVRFVYHNGDSDTYSYVVKQYINNGWLYEGTHYNTGDTIHVDHDIEIFPDYTVNIKPAEFPADPTVDGDTFIGWFSEKTGGTKYTAYSGTENITLHAQWENGTDIYPTILCKRATTLHTEKCERTGSTLGCAALGYSNGDTIYYGSLGNGNILARGDAFTCDVNGDGTFDEATERFYYMSDYYDVTTDTYDPDYAVMIYYANLYDVGMMSEHGASFSTGPDDHAPNNIKKYLPTAELWPNTALKQNIRYVRDYLNEENIEIDYTGYVARLMNFKEVGYDANGNQDIIPEMFEKSLFNKPNNYNHPQFAYYLESYNGQGSTNYYSSTQMGVSPSGRVEYADNAIGLRPAIDVPKERIQLVDDTYTVSIDGEVVETLKGGTIYTIPENTKAKATDTYTVTFNYHNGTNETTSTVEVSYVPNGYTIPNIHFNGGEKIVITGNVSLTSDYIETVIPATFPADPTKENETFTGWFDSETGGNGYTEYSNKADIILHAQYRSNTIDIIIPDEPPIVTPVTPGEPYTLPENTKAKDSENVGSVTFKYNDNETSDLTKYVVVSYTPNGWLINNVHYDDGAEITPTEDTTLVRDYIETVTGIDWPEDPTRTNYEFNGWFTDAELEHEYTLRTYSEKADIDLFAKWTEMVTIDPPGSDPIVVPKGTEVTLPTNNNSKANENVAEVTFKPENGDEDIIRYVQRQFTPSGWLIDGVHYDDGTTYTANASVTPVPDYTYVTVPVEFPSDPIYENHTFTGWFDSQTGGNPITSYAEEIDTTIYAQWSQTLPTEISVQSNAIILVKGEEEQIVVTTTPPDLQNIAYTYTVENGKENIVSVSDEGLITALNPGTADITIAVTEDTSVNTTITVTVINNRITSQVYDVADKNLTGEEIRIIIGAEPETMISDFITNIDNDSDYIEVYNKDDQLISPDSYDETLITTGSKLKLVINGITHDEVIVIIRGDINEDGHVNITDSTSVVSHILLKEMIEGYKVYAADIVETEGAALDEAINVVDNTRIEEYILLKRDSLNEKDGD